MVRTNGYRMASSEREAGEVGYEAADRRLVALAVVCIHALIGYGLWQPGARTNRASVPERIAWLTLAILSPSVRAPPSHRPLIERATGRRAVQPAASSLPASPSSMAAPAMTPAKPMTADWSALAAAAATASASADRTEPQSPASSPHQTFPWQTGPHNPHLHWERSDPLFLHVGGKHCDVAMLLAILPAAAHCTFGQPLGEQARGDLFDPRYRTPALTMPRSPATVTAASATPPAAIAAP